MDRVVRGVGHVVSRLPRSSSAVAALILLSCTSSSEAPVNSRVAASSARSTESPQRGTPPTTDNELAGIACPSQSHCIAVGHLGEGIDTGGPDTRTLILGSDAGGWKVVSSPNAPGRAGSGLNGVTCVAAARCVAVGWSDNSASNPLTLIEEDVGHGWNVVPSPNPSAFGGVGSLSDVACSGPTHCVAVGSYESENGTSQALIEEDLGHGWNLVPTPNTSATDHNLLVAVACPGQSLCIAVGSHASGGIDLPLIERNSGSGWTIVPAPGTGRLSGVACPRISWCVATGGQLSFSSNVMTEQPLIEEMTGGAWASTDTQHVVGTLGHVACPTDSYCISVGRAFAATLGANVSPVIVAERSGPAWTLAGASEFGDNIDSMGGIVCPTPTRCIAVGDQLIARGYPEPRATFIAEHTSRGWTLQPSPNV
jgi:putative hemolysin